MGERARAHAPTRSKAGGAGWFVAARSKDANCLHIRNIRMQAAIFYGARAAMLRAGSAGGASCSRERASQSCARRRLPLGI